ncbi:uncharacterized protein DNG_01660 [Cephalotrichum gorgonifer]|uniref:PWI domain-containing protein n=1 Tax=Cephalotrichum gorgonifer TaxID=2041049 RepID=A0AAE8SRU3_9PEZI|nr:uncharacterized protein DNG_01660 [Cephalotrichum gorgonifer]
MSYNPYGGSNPSANYWQLPANPSPAPGYGPPPTYGGFPGGGPPGMAPPPGLGPPPGMSSAPGLAPPGVHPNTTQANRPSGLPANFQPPPNLPNINFNAKVIRLGGPSPKPSTPTGSRRDDDTRGGPPARAGLGADRGGEHGRSSGRESAPMFIPFTSEERLRTVFVHKVPEAVGGDLERILNAAGRVRRWDGATSVLSESSGTKFGFALYEDAEAFSNAVELLKDVELPTKRQPPTAPDAEQKDDFEGIEKVGLKIAIDESSQKYLDSFRESRGEDADAASRLEAAREALKKVVRELFYPPPATKPDGDGDTRMTDTNGDNVEVVNIPLNQEDELADIPAEMREIVAGEIAAFRERSTRRDMERMKREEEFEEMERSRTNRPRSPLTDAGSTNNIPLGPRALQNPPSGPKGQNAHGVAFVNGIADGSAEDDADVDDEEVHQRQVARQKSEEEQMYLEAERKWVNRERSRAAALARETDREQQGAESLERRRQEQLEREKSWDDEKEAARKAHPYYRDHAAWVRKRNGDRADEQASDNADRRAEQEERRREMAELERTRGMADSFLDRQAEELGQRELAAPAVTQQPFKLSLGAAAQKAQRAAPARRTVAEVEGLLADEEQENSGRRQLVPIQMEASASTSMTDEEISNAMRALAQEIPSEKEGLWAWDVQWDHLDEGVMREKLRPFVEKKIVEYLGVQEEVIVEVIEEHLRKHGKPGDLVDELAEALDEEAEDLVKKLWRMVIFFTESEKRGLPA